MHALGDLVELRRGTTYKSALLYAEGPVLLGLSSIAANGGFRRDSLKRYGGESPPGITLGPGDIYVSLKDVTQSGDLLGAVARVPSDVEAGRLTQDTVKLILREGSGDLSDYVYWLLRSPQYREYCRVHAIGVTTLALPREDFLAYPVPPITPRRTAIVRALRALDDKIEQNTRLAGRLEEAGRVVFGGAVGRLLWDGDVREELPPGWRAATLGELFELNPVRRLPSGTAAPYLEMKNMPTVGHFPEGWYERPAGSGARFVNGDTLVARITPCLENGKIAFVDFLDDDVVGWGSTEYIVMRPKHPIDPPFAYFLARTDDFRDFAVRHMSGSSGRQRVPTEALAAYRIPIPPDQRLNELANVLSAVLASIRALRLESRALAMILDALLPRLVSGRIRVPEGYDLDEVLGAVVEQASAS